LLALLAVLLSAVGGRAPLPSSMTSDLSQRGGCAYAEAVPGVAEQVRAAQCCNAPIVAAHHAAQALSPVRRGADSVAATSVLRRGSAGGARAP